MAMDVHLEEGIDSDRTSSDDLVNFGISADDFKPGSGNTDPVVLERISNFKLDPSKIEIIEDEDEDRPLELHVHCDRFLAAPSDQIEPLFREIPLHDADNFQELTEDSLCVPHFVSKCSIITSSQIEKIIEAHDMKGLKKLYEIRCLQRLTDFSALERGDAFELIKNYPVGDWENWWAFSPDTFLSIISHHKYAHKLAPPPYSTNLSEFLSSSKWKSDPFVWQLFDMTFLHLCADSPSESQKLLELLDFGQRFPLLFKGKIDEQELSLVPRWAVRVFEFIFELCKEPGKTTHSSNIVKSLLGELILAAEKLEELKTDSSTVKSAIKLAKSTILVAPTLIYSALDQTYTSTFKMAKQMRSEIGKLPGHDDIWKLIRQLQDLMKARKETLYKHSRLSTRYHEKALNNLAGPFVQDFKRGFIHLTARPDLSKRELNFLNEFITEDLAGIPLPTQHQQEDDEGEYTIAKNVPEKVRFWLNLSWLTGSTKAFEHVCTQLSKVWQSTQTTEELIVELAQQDSNFIECALGVLKDARKAIQLIMRAEYEEDFKLKLVNIPFEEIHNLPRDDQQFFKPSFDLLSTQENQAIAYHWFQIKFTNEKGVDGGGPRRNWIFKMLYAWMDPKRYFLRTYKDFIIPEIFVHFQVFYGLGRLMGKGLFQDAGVPFAFHPDFVALIKNHNDKDLMERLFIKWYEQDLIELDGILLMAKSDGFETIGDLGLVDIAHWQVTDDACGSTVAANTMTVIGRGCRVPIQRKLKGGSTKRSLEEWIQMEGSAFKDLEKTVQVQKLDAKITEDFVFNPQSLEQVENYVKLAREFALSHFRAGIDAFVKGLNVFVDVSMFGFLKDEVLKQVFSPTVEIDVESLIEAFQFEGAGELTVAIAHPELLPSEFLSKAMKVGSKPDLRIGVIDAFKHAVRQLSMEELHGLVGQLTGSRVTGLGGFQPNQFVVTFSQKLSQRPLIEEETCPTETSEATPNDGEKRIKPGVDLPFTASCSRSINMPLYATFEEICLAVLVVSRASDEFPRT